MLLLGYSYCVHICQPEGTHKSVNFYKNVLCGEQRHLSAWICAPAKILGMTVLLFLCHKRGKNTISPISRMKSVSPKKFTSGALLIMTEVWRDSHQLLEVVLHRVGINHHANGYQRVKGKVEDLVAEEWNDPSCMLLRRTDGGGKRRHMVSNKARCFHSLFVLFTCLPCMHRMLPCHI